VVMLQAVENQPRLLEGRIKSLSTGSYRIELDIPDLKERVTGKNVVEDRRDVFSVLLPDDGEMLDLATDWSLLESMAVRSSGEVFTPESVSRLVDRLTRQTIERSRREPLRLWQDSPPVWWLLTGLVLLLTAEWVVRKSAGLS